MSELLRFSSEACELLKKDRIPVCLLTGKSIKDMRQADRKIEPQWPDQDYLEGLTSRMSEVALEWTWLRGTMNKPLDEQLDVINRYSKRLQERIPGVKVIVGEAPDYVEVAGIFFDRTQKGMFNSDGPLWIPKLFRGLFTSRVATRTLTPIRSRQGNFLAIVTTFNDVIRVDGWPRDFGTHLCVATPLIVPDT